MPAKWADRGGWHFDLAVLGGFSAGAILASHPRDFADEFVAPVRIHRGDDCSAARGNSGVEKNGGVYGVRRRRCRRGAEKDDEGLAG
jgi:hypothetical protein